MLALVLNEDSVTNFSLNSESIHDLLPCSEKYCIVDRLAMNWTFFFNSFFDVTYMPRNY